MCPLRRNLPLPPREVKLVPMVMQLHHKEEVDLRENRSPHQGKA